MDIVNTIIMIVGFVVIGLWQHHQIKALKEQITSQEGLIANLKMFNEIFDAQKVREYTRLSEEAIKKKKDMEIEKIITKFNKQLQETTETSETYRKRSAWLLSTLFEMIYYVHPDSRKKVIDKRQDNYYKPPVEEACNGLPYKDPNVIKLEVHSVSHSHNLSEAAIEH